MPVTGRKPKDNPRNRNTPTYDWTEVRDIPFARGPRLPRYRLGGRAWPTQTKRWWKAVSTMPHCVLWGESDWSYAIDTAMIAAEFHDGERAAATELRHREKVMGTTVDTRRDLRIRYIPATAPTDEPVGDGTVATVSRLDDHRLVE